MRREDASSTHSLRVRRVTESAFALDYGKLQAK